jgi:hypothetical protein
MKTPKIDHNPLLVTATFTMILSDLLVPFSPLQQYGMLQIQILPAACAIGSFLFGYVDDVSAITIYWF